MKLPRDVSASALEQSLKKAFGYTFTRQIGSHCRLTTSEKGVHHITLPAHNPLKPGTLRSILREVASRQNLTTDEVLSLLNL